MDAPVSAVTHPDPYPYYAELVAQRPLYRDEGLRLWVASSAAAVTAVLSSDLRRVRPPAAEIFRHLVRMNDGRGHQPFKQAVSATLGADGLFMVRRISHPLRPPVSGGASMGGFRYPSV